MYSACRPLELDKIDATKFDVNWRLINKLNLNVAAEDEVDMMVGAILTKFSVSSSRKAEKEPGQDWIFSRTAKENVKYRDPNILFHKISRL